MKALSIRQPWCWCILNLHKDVENRSWKPSNPGIRFRGRFLIHASSGMTKAEYEDCLDTVLHAERFRTFPDGWKMPSIEEFKATMMGGIVGEADIIDVVRGHHPSPWFFGPVGLVIRNAKPLPFRPMKGQLGFFDVPA